MEAEQKAAGQRTEGSDWKRSCKVPPCFPKGLNSKLSTEFFPSAYWKQQPQRNIIDTGSRVKINFIQGNEWTEEFSDNRNKDPATTRLHLFQRRRRGGLEETGACWTGRANDSQWEMKRNQLKARQKRCLKALNGHQWRSSSWSHMQWEGR